MEASDNKTAYKRNKRIKIMKKTIIAVCIILIFVPIILCILLFVKLNKLQEKLDSIIAMKESKEVVLTSNELREVPPINEKTVYLTFDDGPSIYTDDIIEILNNYGVKATFFVVGKDDDRSLELYKEIVNSGNAIGLHTYSHKFESVYSSKDGFIREVSSLRKLIYKTTGEDVTLFRFPGGSSSPKLRAYGEDPAEFANYLNENGYKYFDWNVSSGDGSPKVNPKEAIVNNVINGVAGKQSSVVLMHDDQNKGTTVEALPAIIEWLLNNGYEIRGIDNTVVPVQHILASKN